jgi:hypothetical protein
VGILGRACDGDAAQERRAVQTQIQGAVQVQVQGAERAQIRIPIKIESESV